MSMGSEEGDKHLQTEGVPSALRLIASHVVRIWDDDYDDVPKKNTQAKTAKKKEVQPSMFAWRWPTCVLPFSTVYSCLLIACLLTIGQAGRHHHYIISSKVEPSRAEPAAKPMRCAADMVENEHE